MKRAVIIMLLIAGIAAAGWWFVAPRATLAGPDVYDFGVVPLQYNKMTVTKTIEFVNESSVTVELTRAVASCGCTKVTYDPSIIAPGETVRVTVHLELSSAGRTQEYVSLETAIGGKTQGLRRIDILADARPVQRVYSATNLIPLKPGDQREIPVSVWLYPEESTAPPTIELIAGPEPRAAVELKRWYEDRPYDEKTGTPAVWRAMVQVTLDDAYAGGDLQAQLVRAGGETEPVVFPAR